MSRAVTQIATLVLARADGTALARGAEALGLQGTRILSQGRAIEGRSEAVGSADARRILDAAGVVGDVCVQPEAGRRKTALVCDMDSTLIGQECIDELADFAGVKDRVSAITERAMRGEIGFEGALLERVALLRGLPLSVLEACFRERITLNPGARALARTMAAHGAKTLIVSGGFTYFSERVARACGFAGHQANVLLHADGRLSGDVARPILGRDAKREALLALTNGEPDTALCIGDGANDLAMIEAAGLGIAVYAKPAVTAASHSAIASTDLRSALYFQGYADDDITE